MEQTIKIAVEAKTTIPHEQLLPFQGDLKHLPKEQYEKLRKNIIDNGFSFSVHVWPFEDKFFIIDGHQRVFTVGQMAKKEGWVIPPLPVSIVHAGSFLEAKMKVLAGASQFGQVTDQGLLNFIQENDIPFDDLVASFDFPEVDFGDFAESMMNIDAGKTLPDAEGETPEMKSGSDSVRQVQLLFNSENHQEFMEKVEDLSEHYGTENITDTIIEVVRADHRAKRTVTQ